LSCGVAVVPARRGGDWWAWCGGGGGGGLRRRGGALGARRARGLVGLGAARAPPRGAEPPHPPRRCCAHFSACGSGESVLGDAEIRIVGDEAISLRGERSDEQGVVLGHLEPAVLDREASECH